MNDIKKNSKKKYKKIVKQSKFWPIVQLFKDRKGFMNEVSQKTQNKILEKIKPEELYDELINTVYKEKLRISKKSWKADPADDKKFWYTLKDKIIEFESDKNNPKIKNEILPIVIDRYTEEITGNFKRSHHGFAKRLITSFLARLLNTARLRNPLGSLNLDSTIQIFGRHKRLRKLSKTGTIVMVPTHFSHLDSALIGWIISHLGLPAFMYGAGLVLYNLKIFAYFFNSLGAYKVDRRKKHFLYLETLKTYTERAIINGCHNLFYPGGTRSRSGSIEKNLKLGLLGSTLEAQKELNKENKKIYIVPVTFNYQFVLEGPALINQYLSKNKLNKDLGYSNTFKIFTFLIKYFTRSNRIAVTFGNPLDIYGNRVNKDGNPINKNNLSLEKNNKTEILNNLSEKIIDELMAGTVVFSSLILSFTSFEIIRKKFRKMDVENIIELPEDELTLNIEYFKTKYKNVLESVKNLSEKKKLKISDELLLSIDDQIKIGCKNLGLYHAIRPLELKKDKIIIKNIKMLFYYRNRLDGYGIEKII